MLKAIDKNTIIYIQIPCFELVEACVTVIVEGVVVEICELEAVALQNNSGSSIFVFFTNFSSLHFF